MAFSKGYPKSEMVENQWSRTSLQGKSLVGSWVWPGLKPFLKAPKIAVLPLTGYKITPTFCSRSSHAPGGEEKAMAAPQFVQVSDFLGDSQVGME